MSDAENAPELVKNPPGAAAGPVASIDDLHVSFHTRHGVVSALRGVSLDIAPGEVVALVGESGSGKSVLGLSLLGLLPAAAKPKVTGSARVAGVDMLAGSPAQARHVRRHLLGAVFQDPLTSLNPTMRIGRQLTERRISPRTARARLTEAGVPEPDRRARQFPHELSGGLRQRVMIAMALAADGRWRQDPDAPADPGSLPDPAGTPADAADGAGAADAAAAVRVDVVTAGDDGGAPRLVIADEPTTALDVSVQAQVVLLFDRIRREHGCAVLLITHDLGVAASIADRIVVLYAGRVCEQGPAAQVLTAPAHPYTRALLGARLSVEGSGAADALPGEPPDPVHPPPGCAFAPRCPRAQDACTADAPALVARPAGPGQVACLFPHAPDTGPPALADRRMLARSPRAADGGDALVLDAVRRSFPAQTGRGAPREVTAVADVSLTVPKRGSVALVGESGCGKTTTLRIATGLTRPDAGSVRWAADGGRPQMVFQDCSSSLTPWLSIGVQIEERLRALGVGRADRQPRMLELLSRVGLSERAARSKSRELSGGQRQRAVIARALASEPRLLVCDEPVSALDASLAGRVLTLLESLRDDLGVALLVVTHDLAVARRIADRVAVMYLGRIVEEAPTAELFANPRHPYTHGLLAASPTTEPGRLSPTLGGEPPGALGEVSGCAFAGRCPLVEDRCRSEAPPLRPAGESTGVRVACHFAEDTPRRLRELAVPPGVEAAVGAS